MADFFATPAAASLTIIVLIVQLCSLLMLCIGLVCYKRLTTSRQSFLSSLQPRDNVRIRAYHGWIAWFYALSTLIVIVGGTAAYFLFFNPANV